MVSPNKAIFFRIDKIVPAASSSARAKSVFSSARSGKTRAYISPKCATEEPEKENVKD